MSEAWKAAVHYKQHCVWNMLERSPPGAHLLLIDGDVTLFQDPFKALLRPNASSPADDMVLMDDGTPTLTKTYLNSGFMLLRNTAATRNFGRSYLSALAQSRSRNDQDVFNDVLQTMSATGPFARHNSGRRLDASAGTDVPHHPKKAHEFMSLTSRAMRMAHRTLDLAMGGKAAGSGGRASGGKIGGGGKTGGKQHAAAAGISAGPIPSAGGSASRGGRRERHSGVRVSALSSTTFPCGYFFYEYRHKQPLDPKQVVAVHHNWIRGDRNKWERARAYDAVVTDSGETHREFVRRTRSAMVRMPAWQYRNPSHPGNKPAR